MKRKPAPHYVVQTRSAQVERWQTFKKFPTREKAVAEAERIVPLVKPTPAVRVRRGGAGGETVWTGGAI